MDFNSVVRIIPKSWHQHFILLGRSHYSTIGDGLLRKKQLQKIQIKSGRASGIAVLQIIYEYAQIIKILGHITIFS